MWEHDEHHWRTPEIMPIECKCGTLVDANRDLSFLKIIQIRCLTSHCCV